MTEGPKTVGENGAVNGSAEPNEWEKMALEAAKEAAIRTAKEKEEEDLASNEKDKKVKENEKFPPAHGFAVNGITKMAESRTPRNEGESDDEYRARVLKTIAGIFGDELAGADARLPKSGEVSTLLALWPHGEGETTDAWCSRIANELVGNSSKASEMTAENTDALSESLADTMRRMKASETVHRRIFGGDDVDTDAYAKEDELVEQEIAAIKQRENPYAVSEEDVAYQKRLIELQQRGDDFDPLTNEAMARNESGSDIPADMMESNMDSFIAETMKSMPQEPDESSEEYRKRVLDKVYSVYDESASQAREELAGTNIPLNHDEDMLRHLNRNFPRQEGESTADWAKRINEETGVQIGKNDPTENTGSTGETSAESAEEALSDREKFDKRLNEIKSVFEKDVNFDGTIETDEHYENRMKAAVFSEIMTEQAENPNRKLNAVELSELTKMYPRNEGESDDDWAKRIKAETNITVELNGATRADMGADGASKAEGAESAEDAEKHARAERARQALKTNLFDNMRRKYNVSDEDLDNMSDDDALLALEAYKQQLEDWAKRPVEEGGAGYNDEDLKKISEAGGVYLEDLMKSFNEYLGAELDKDSKEGDKGAEDAEAKEAERKRMMEAMDIPDLRDLLKAEGLNNDDIEKMSPEELKDLQERLRKRMVESLDINDLKDLLKGENIKTADLEKMSFEELRDLREKYRQKYMSDIDVKENADKLKEWGIKDVVLENMTLEQLIALKKRLETEGKGKPEEDDKKREPLIAVMIDRERDAKIAAKALAEDMLKMRIEGNGKSKIGKAMRNWFFGTLLKNYEDRRYERLALEAIKGKKDKFESDGYSIDINNVWSYLGDGAGGKLVERMTLAYTEGMEDSLIHSANGDEMATYGVEIENGKQVVYKYSERGNKKEAVDANSAEAKSTIAVREAIASYATGKMSERDFREAVSRAKNDMAKEGHDDTSMIDTLFETARAAKASVEQEVSINDVMDGFRLINADYQARERTEAHRTKIDQLVDKYESSKLGAIIKPEIIAAAAGIFMTLGQSGARTIGNAVAPMIGGAAVGGFIAGLKEHEHVATDRAEQARRIARGEEIGDTKYDRQMKETMYETYSANDLSDGLKKAIESGNMADIQKGLAMVEALNQISDTKKIDLIRFTGGDVTTMEDERLALDVQIARAKVELRNHGIQDTSKEYVEATRRAHEVINDDIDAKDAAFKKLQAKRVAAQFAKTAGMGIAIGAGTQEVMAAFDPNSYGLIDKLNDNLNIRFEKFGIGVNNLDAHKTMLAGFLGIDHTQAVTVMEQVRAAEATGAKLTDEEVEELRKQGYTVNERDVVTTREVTRTETMSADEYAHENGVAVRRSWGNNGTEGVYEGNELGIHQAEDGHLYTRMHGDSWNGSQRVNFDQAAQDGKVKMFLSLSKDTQGTPIEITGTLKDGQIHFFTEDPALTDIIAKGDFAYAEVAYVSGEVTEAGAQKIFNFATEVGHNSVSESFTRTITDTVVDHNTVFDVIGFDRQAEQILQGSSLIDGAPAIPFASRKNLTRGKKGKNHGPRGPENPLPPADPGNPGGGGGEGPKQVDPNPPSRNTGNNGNPPVPPAGGPTNGNPPVNQPAPKVEQVAQKPAQPRTEQKPDNQQPQLEQKPADGFESAADLGEPWGNMVTRVEFTDEEIDALESANEGFKERMKKAIELWNSASEEDRRKYMTGYGELGTELNDACQMLMHLGRDYIGQLDAVEKTRARARDALAKKKAAEAAEAAAKAQGDEESDEMMRQADSYRPIIDLSDTRSIQVSDKRINELNPFQKPTTADLERIRDALGDWNLMEASQRHAVLEGLAKGDGSAAKFDVLKKFNIIVVDEADAEAESKAA